MNRMIYILAISFIAVTSIGYAKVTVIGVEIPGLFQKDGNGSYDKIVTRTVVNSGHAKLEILPPDEAFKKFENCTECCIAPANLDPDFYSFGSNVVATNSMFASKIYIFTAKDQPALDSLDQLKEKKVGIRTGMPYGNVFKSAGLETYAVPDIKWNIQQLDAGRIDAFVAYVPDAYTAFDEMGVEPYPYVKKSPLAIHPDALVCRGVSDDFINAFNNEL